MKIVPIVIDTNVFISALRSRNGASHRLLSLIDTGRFETCLSVPLVLEYEDVAYRMVKKLDLSKKDVDDVLDYMCAVSRHQQIFYLWRPFLKDPKDDMVLELAVAANGRYIVSFNIKDFAGIEQFGIEVLTPQEFLKKIGERL